ncbi:MAG: tRNA pseudouridine(55) synthase TruB [Thermodesulfovibrionia bacterium]
MELIINLNKPDKMTSQEAVSKVKWILRISKAGHAGTLDPMATGVLLICIDRATRLASYFSSLNKEYHAIMKLGETTDTQDATGVVIKRIEVSGISKEKIEEVVKTFRGRLLQRPPMFSALKHKGRALYEYARRGEEIERDYREVTIYDIRLLNIELPFVRFDVVCSKGTYIRTLCNDIGERLGVGAHLFGLKRTAIGPFTINDSITLDGLSEAYKMGLEGKGIYRMDDALSFMPQLILNDRQVRSVSNGAPLRVNDIHGLSDDMKVSEGIRLKSPDGRLIAIGSFLESKGLIKMDVVFGT